MFIKPDELNGLLLEAGFSPREIRGLAPIFSSSALKKTVSTRSKGESPAKPGAVVKLGESSFKAGLYMGSALK